MSDKRRDQRIGIKLDVELEVEDKEPSVLKTRDLSNSGVFLESASDSLPVEGSIVTIRIKQSFAEGEAPKVRAQVVRVDNEGIALKFILDE